MSDKQQIAQQVAVSGGDVSAVWSWIHGLLGGAVVWLGNQFVQTAIKDKLDDNKEATENLSKEVAALRSELTELKADNRERKVIAESQERSIERILNKLEKLD